MGEHHVVLDCWDSCRTVDSNPSRCGGRICLVRVWHMMFGESVDKLCCDGFDDIALDVDREDVRLS